MGVAVGDVDTLMPHPTKKSNRVIKMPKFLCGEMEDYLKMFYSTGATESRTAASICSSSSGDTRKATVLFLQRFLLSRFFSDMVTSPSFQSPACPPFQSALWETDRLKGKDVITTPKTKKSNRVIKMPKFLCGEMED